MIPRCLRRGDSLALHLSKIIWCSYFSNCSTTEIGKRSHSSIGVLKLSDHLILILFGIDIFSVSGFQHNTRFLKSCICQIDLPPLWETTCPCPYRMNVLIRLLSDSSLQSPFLFFPPAWPMYLTIVLFTHLFPRSSIG